MLLLVDGFAVEHPGPVVSFWAIAVPVGALVPTARYPLGEVARP